MSERTHWKLAFSAGISESLQFRRWLEEQMDLGDDAFHKLRHAPVNIDRDHKASTDLVTIEHDWFICPPGWSKMIGTVLGKAKEMEVAGAYASINLDDGRWCTRTNNMGLVMPVRPVICKPELTPVHIMKGSP